MILGLAPDSPLIFLAFVGDFDATVQLPSTRLRVVVDWINYCFDGLNYTLFAGSSLLSNLAFIWLPPSSMRESLSASYIDSLPSMVYVPGPLLDNCRV